MGLPEGPKGGATMELNPHLLRLMGQGRVFKVPPWQKPTVILHTPRLQDIDLVSKSFQCSRSFTERKGAKTWASVSLKGPDWYRAARVPLNARISKPVAAEFAPTMSL